MSPPPPSIFSSHINGLRLVWDSTTLGAYMQDPLNYFVRYVLGWRSDDEEPLTMAFGRLYHEAVRELWMGVPLQTVLQSLLFRAEECGYEETYAEAPQTQQRGRRLRDLSRALVWYDTWRKREQDYVILDQEVKFVRSLGENPFTKEEMHFVGTLDAIARDERRTFAIERKTTNTTITSSSYWRQFDPSLQTWAYDWLLGGSRTMSGRILLEACQTGATFARFENQWVTRTPAQRRQFDDLVRYWIDRASQDAAQGTFLPNLSIRFPTDASRRLARYTPRELHEHLAQTGEQQPLWNPLTAKRDCPIPHVDLRRDE